PTAAEQYKVPLVDVGPEYFFDASNGVEAVGILKTPTATDPNEFALSLVLRNYAKAGDPVATDAMLVSDKPRGGLIVSKTVNNEVHDMIPVNHKQEETVLRHWRHLHWIQAQKSSL